MLSVDVYRTPFDYIKKRARWGRVSKTSELLTPTVNFHELYTDKGRSKWLGVLGVAVRSLDLSTEGSPEGIVRIGPSGRGKELAYIHIFRGDERMFLDGKGQVVVIKGV